MTDRGIDRLIINSPYKKPKQHWKFDTKFGRFNLEEGRRPAGYIVASEHSKSFDDPGIFKPIELVDKIRKSVDSWRDAGYPGTTGITRQLLTHWTDREERTERLLFFCQLEAIETLIWLREAPESERVGITIPIDEGSFPRFCNKMATGSGKTIVMAMLIAWQILNKVTYPNDPRFSKNVFVVAPGLTVKNRLQVLIPGSDGNYYTDFNIVPSSLADKLIQGKVLVKNWHALAWDNEEQLAKRHSVDKRGPLSNEAYVRFVLGEISKSKNLIIINDEAHHAWRIPAESKIKDIAKEDIEEATTWIRGLDRIHITRNILACYDFSATPFAPTGKQSTEEALFSWIVSDFGLNDAIESGLVKTPRVVIRDDGKLTPDMKSRLYHLYMDPEVKIDLNRKAAAHEPLPDLVNNAYNLLGADWLTYRERWIEAEMPTPPVMITVANRTETAARVQYAFSHKRIKVPELCDTDTILHIDSKVLKSAEERGNGEGNGFEVNNEDDEQLVRKLSQKEREEELRKMVYTVGQSGKPGAKIQNVISVGMLSEGWDAKTVTHIMGLRAFSSQLLCEQVVGRGLRRASYDVDPETDLFVPEYVNIFGVPFTFLPHESTEDTPPRPEKPKVSVEPDPAKSQFEITWPNIIKVEHLYKPTLTLDLDKVEPLIISKKDIIVTAELAPVLDGKPDIDKMSTIELDEIGRKYRMQQIIFETARDVYEEMNPSWRGNKDYLLGQVFRIVDSFIRSEKIVITPTNHPQDSPLRRILITLTMQRVVQHVLNAIRFQDTESVEPIFDQTNPIRSTANMSTWYTGRLAVWTRKSHINRCVVDSTWEASEAFELDRNDLVNSWVKNDHLGFEIQYVHNGIRRNYRPDFIIRLANGQYLILETKGQETDQDKTKREYLKEWIQAVNTQGGFGTWHSAISKDPADVRDLIEKIET